MGKGTIYLALAGAALSCASPREHLSARFPAEATDSVAITYKQGMQDLEALAQDTGPEAAYIFNPVLGKWYETGARHADFPSGTVLEEQGARIIDVTVGTATPLHVHIHRRTQEAQESVIERAYQAQLRFNPGLPEAERTKLRRRIENYFSVRYALPSDRDIPQAALRSALVRAAHPGASVQHSVVTQYGTVFYDVSWERTDSASLDSLAQQYAADVVRFGDPLVELGYDATKSPQELLELLCRSVSTNEYKLRFVPR